MPTETEESRHISSPYRPRSLAAMLLVAFAVSLLVGVWVNLASVLLPTPLTVPFLLGLSLVFALIVVPAVIPWRVVVGADRVRASYLAWSRTVPCASVRRVRVAREGLLDRLVFGRGASHPLVLEHSSPRGAPRTTSLTVDHGTLEALRRVLADREWTRQG